MYWWGKHRTVILIPDYWDLTLEAIRQYASREPNVGLSPEGIFTSFSKSMYEPNEFPDRQPEIIIARRSLLIDFEFGVYDSSVYTITDWIHRNCRPLTVKNELGTVLERI